MKICITIRIKSIKNILWVVILKKIANFCIVLALLTLYNLSQAQPIPNFPILKISNENRSILLVGSNHTAPLNIYDHSAAQTLAAANSLCLEVLPSEREAAIKTMRATMLNNTGRTLVQRHGQSVADEVTVALSWNSLLTNRLNNLSDQALGTLLWIVPTVDQDHPPATMRPDYSIDASLLNFAMQHNLKLGSIEDLDAIEKSSLNITQEKWSDYLKKSLELSKCKECQRELAKHMAQQYVPSANYEDAYKEVHAAFGSNESLFNYYDEINIRSRNVGLAQNIYTRALNLGECDVVAVGATHLGGPHGIVALLKKIGVKVSSRYVDN
ncbi:TraB/GumN family protein [Janthinobacterium sp. PAMC25594]|uniref:TraB/GumN family protein n=1 Tax=Janthinobacterium sp. PAMC25594 TaxID=2861284 RepID=UPI001C629707|nr:TraB/GumN family protein [Janthinobacterium sp. PAMC25594]QYG05630.1 TraB/GumN family protein [Janthinobacterium sp. PAMC25594]